MTNRIGGPTLPSGFVVLGIIAMLVFAVIAVRVGQVLGSGEESSSVVVPLDRSQLVAGSTVTLDLPSSAGSVAVTVTPPDLLDLSGLPLDAAGAATIRDCSGGCRLVLEVVRNSGSNESSAILIDYEAGDAVDLDRISPQYG